MPLIVLTAFIAQVASPPALGSNPAPAEPLSNLARILSALTVIAVEIVAIALVCGVVYALLLAVLRAPAVPGARHEWRRVVRMKARAVLLVLALVMAAGVLSVNGYWFVRGVDAQRHTLDLVRSIGAGTWAGLVAALTRLTLAVIALLVAIRVARRLLRAGQRWLSRWGQHGDNNRGLTTLVAGLEGAVVNDRLDARGRVRLHPVCGAGACHHHAAAGRAHLRGRGDRPDRHPLDDGDRRHRRRPRPAVCTAAELAASLRSPAGAAADAPRLRRVCVVGRRRLARARAAVVDAESRGLGAARHPAPSPSSLPAASSSSSAASSSLIACCRGKAWRRPIAAAARR